MSSRVQENIERFTNDVGFEVEASASQLTEQDRDYCIVTNRDPEDVRTIWRLTQSNVVFALLSVMLGIMLFYQVTRPTSAIIVERGPDGALVVSGTNQNPGQPGMVQFGVDQPGDGDKKHLAKKWSELFLRIDPKTRQVDLANGLRMMTAEAAQALVAQAKQSGEWETQKREEWQTVWTLQDVSIGRDDKYQVHLIGLQEIRSTVGGAMQQRVRQLIFTLLLKADSAGRNEDNQNSGFRVAGITDMKILDHPTDGSQAGMRAVTSGQQAN